MGGIGRRCKSGGMAFCFTTEAPPKFRFVHESFDRVRDRFGLTLGKKAPIVLRELSVGHRDVDQRAAARHGLTRR